MPKLKDASGCTPGLDGRAGSATAGADGAAAGSCGAAAGPCVLHAAPGKRLLVSGGWLNGTCCMAQHAVLCSGVAASGDTSEGAKRKTRESRQAESNQPLYVRAGRACLSGLTDANPASKPLPDRSTGTSAASISPAKTTSPDSVSVDCSAACNWHEELAWEGGQGALELNSAAGISRMRCAAATVCSTTAARTSAAGLSWTDMRCSWSCSSSTPPALAPAALRCSSPGTKPCVSRRTRPRANARTSFALRSHASSSWTAARRSWTLACPSCTAAPPYTRGARPNAYPRPPLPTRCSLAASDHGMHL